jgi:hypothetical protein
LALAIVGTSRDLGGIPGSQQRNDTEKAQFKEFHRCLSMSGDIPVWMKDSKSLYHSSKMFEGRRKTHLFLWRE